jgi:hypothetical protein
MVDQAGVRAFTGTIGFEVGDERFIATPGPDGLPIRRDDPASADALFRAPAAPLIAAVFYGKAPPESLAAEGLRVEGDRALAARFVDLFHLPEKVG